MHNESTSVSFCDQYRGARARRTRATPGNAATHIEELPIYPEQRQCKRPTTEQLLRLFSLAEQHTLLADGQTIQVFHTELTDLQRQVLTLLGMPLESYQPQK